MRVRVLLNLLVSAGGLLLSLATASFLFAEEKTQVQPKVTGNYEQLIEIQRQAVDQALLAVQTAARNRKAVQQVINQYEARLQQRQQQEEQKEPRDQEPEEEQEQEQEPLRSLEQPPVK